MYTRIRMYIPIDIYAHTYTCGPLDRLPAILGKLRAVSANNVCIHVFMYVYRYVYIHILLCTKICVEYIHAYAGMFVHVYMCLCVEATHEPTAMWLETALDMDLPQSPPPGAPNRSRRIRRCQRGLARSPRSMGGALLQGLRLQQKYNMYVCIYIYICVYIYIFMYIHVRVGVAICSIYGPND